MSWHTATLICLLTVRRLSCCRGRVESCDRGHVVFDTFNKHFVGPFRVLLPTFPSKPYSLGLEEVLDTPPFPLSHTPTFQISRPRPVAAQGCPWAWPLLSLLLSPALLWAGAGNGKQDFALSTGLILICAQASRSILARSSGLGTHDEQNAQEIGGPEGPC